MKTPYQIAKELGVSSQAVYQKIERMQEQLESYIQREGKKTLVDQQGETLLKSTFARVNAQESVEQELGQDNSNIEQIFIQEMQDLEQRLINQLDAENTYLREQNKSLQDELTVEREHSRQQSERLAELSDKLAKLTENGQVLLLKERETLLLSDKQSIWQKLFKRG